MFLPAFCLGLLVSGLAFGQTATRASISGYVYDQGDGRPLADANVFLASTMLGSATNRAGYFRIANVPPGQYELVVSMIGFEALKRTVRLRQGRNRHFVFRLKPVALQAPDIVVIGMGQKTWEKHFGTFRKFFLSTSGNATECKILNPEVVQFSENGPTKKLTAWAEDILVIENRALGYRLNYLLENFELTPDLLRYTGQTRFEALRDTSEAERRRWQRNRRKTYRGSLRHFLRALVTQRLEEEGFLVYKMPELGEQVYHAELEAVDPRTLVKPGAVPSEYTVRFLDYLQVMYTHAVEPQEYIYWRLNYDQTALRLNTRRRQESLRPQAQTSWIVMNKSFVTVDTTGYAYDPLAFTVYGYWAWQGVADLLPLEYVPD